ncbi:uncharacterized protein LOC129005905 [Macrosteles quadrilineatus]|uniref:uncharacterized protein LOC129005905 n=1 Tax=Macrosteles quadrilineatus TaxID=74068 RepID=UPI0023E0BF29|nr:uncharacterized protein LOC129005905 [Macrosteles quadrilineatus]
MAKADVECITADGIPWRCQPCGETRRKSMRFEAEAEEGKLTLHDLMTKITEIADNQKTQEVNFNKSYEALNEKLEENIKINMEQRTTIENSLRLINELIQENKSLNKKVLELEQKVEDMEQYSRANTLEIHGIPYQKGEDVIGVVKEVGKALDLNIADTMIDACHRLGKDLGPNNKPPGIIVKFVRRSDKEEMLRKRRIKNTLSTRHLNLAMDQPVYINEALSPARRRLFAAARQVKRDKHYKYLWVRGGKIFLRKEESAAVIHVRCQADLDKL